MVYVRKAGEEAAVARDPATLAEDGGSFAVAADTLVSSAKEGPFAPLAVALERDAVLRDAFARVLPVPSITRWSRVRFGVLGLAAAPLLLLLELDRELVSKSIEGGGRLVLDLLVLAFVVFELTRRTPRWPSIAATALLAVAMRWLLVAARLCGANVNAAVWGGAALALGAALLAFVRGPTRSRVSLELLDKLGISRADALAARPVPLADNRLLTAAVVATAGLPLLGWQLRTNGVPLWAQGLFAVLYALLAPAVVRRLFAAPAPVTRVNVVLTLVAILTALALTTALLQGTHHFFDAGGELARCTGRLDKASRILLDREAAELTARIANVRASASLVLMATCIVPFVEERIFRGVLMDALVRRYGLSYGLFVSSLAFGFAHVGIYEVALYQTVLLGVGFGLAYAEGGLVAAFAVHALWNLLNVA